MDYAIPMVMMVSSANKKSTIYIPVTCVKTLHRPSHLLLIWLTNMFVLDVKDFNNDKILNLTKFDILQVAQFLKRK